MKKAPELGPEADPRAPTNAIDIATTPDGADGVTVLKTPKLTALNADKEALSTSNTMTPGIKSRTAIKTASAQGLKADPSVWKKIVDVAQTKPDSAAGEQAIKVLEKNKAAAIENSLSGKGSFTDQDVYDHITGYFASTDGDAREALAVSRIHRAAIDKDAPYSSVDVILTEGAASKDEEAARKGGEAAAKVRIAAMGGKTAGGSLSSLAVMRTFSPAVKLPEERRSARVKAQAQAILDARLKQG